MANNIKDENTKIGFSQEDIIARYIFLNKESLSLQNKKEALEKRRKKIRESLKKIKIHEKETELDIIRTVNITCMVEGEMKGLKHSLTPENHKKMVDVLKQKSEKTS